MLERFSGQVITIIEWHLAAIKTAKNFFANWFASKQLLIAIRIVYHLLFEQIPSLIINVFIVDHFAYILLKLDI